MDKDLLLRLSDADAIAGDEGEVRAIVSEALRDVRCEVLRDGLGSLIYHLPPTTEHADEDPGCAMFCAHMDEVGFVVRNISPIGILYLLPVGGVLQKSRDMQLVRVTAEDGTKLPGIMNVTRTATGEVDQTYVDLGFDSDEAVRQAGVAEGCMVTFATRATTLAGTRVAGKALDDRTGCLAMVQAIRLLAAPGVERRADLYFAFTSSEEVGTRGGKTTTDLVLPDLVVAVDTANHPELDRGFTDHRLLGAGPMLEHYDKTMSPSRPLLRRVRALLEERGIAFQRDMFGGGGTDAGAAHLVEGGRLALVLGVPLRYCHGSCSIADMGDVDGATQAICAIAQACDREFLDEAAYD